MAEKMTDKGLVIGLIVDQKETKRGKGKPFKPKGEEKKPADESPDQGDNIEQPEKGEA